MTAYTYPDVERLVAAYLKPKVAEVEPNVTVGIGLPKSWTPSSPAHVQVVCDGHPSGTHPIAANATVRLVAWAKDTDEAKYLAGLAHGLLLAHPGGGGIASTAYFTGPLPARDPETRAEIASVTARVTVRSVPVEPLVS